MEDKKNEQDKNMQHEDRPMQGNNEEHDQCYEVSNQDECDTESCCEMFCCCC